MMTADEESGVHCQIPLGIIHGLPCHLDLRREEDGLLWCMICSDFFNQKEDGWPLAIPEGEADWKYADDDDGVVFEYSIARGSIGAINLDRGWYNMSAKTATWLLQSIPAEALVYDEQGQLQITLDLEIDQHRTC